PEASGRPMTGLTVMDATAPGSAAAMPAPAMKTCVPAVSASATRARRRSGARGAEQTPACQLTPKRASTSSAGLAAATSDFEPTITWTWGTSSPFPAAAGEDSHQGFSPHRPLLQRIAHLIQLALRLDRRGDDQLGLVHLADVARAAHAHGQAQGAHQ